MLFGQQAGDRFALFLGQFVGVSRSRIGQCRLAKHEATVLDVIPRTLSSGVGIQGHELTQSQFELLAGVVEELSVDFLIDIPVVEAILLDHLVTESSRLHDILHDGVLRIGNVHHQRGECLRTDAIQRIVELLIVPTDLVGKISGNDTSLLIRDLPTAEVTCDSSDPLLDGFGNTLDMELIRISHIGQHHGVCTIQPIKLLCGHVCHTHILQDFHPILIAHEGSQGILQHFIVCSLDGILLGILEACVLGHQIVEQIVHRGVEPFVSLCLQQVTELVLVRLSLGIEPCELFVREAVSVVIELGQDVFGLSYQRSFFLRHANGDALTDQIVIGDVVGEEVVSQFQSLGCEDLHVFLDIRLLVAMVKELIQITDRLADLVPKLGLLRSHLLVLLDLLDMILGLLGFLLPLSLDNLSQRLGGFHIQESLIVAVDFLGDLFRLVLKLSELLSIILALAEADLADLGIQVTQFRLQFIQLLDVSLVVLDHLVLNAVLADALKGICQQMTVRDVVGLLGGVTDIRVVFVKGTNVFCGRLNLVTVECYGQGYLAMRIILNDTIVSVVSHQLLHIVAVHSVRIHAKLVRHLLPQVAAAIVNKWCLDSQVCFDHTATITLCSIQFFCGKVIALAQRFQAQTTFLNRFAVIKHIELPVLCPRPMVHHLWCAVSIDYACTWNFSCIEFAIIFLDKFIQIRYTIDSG